MVSLRDQENVLNVSINLHWMVKSSNNKYKMGDKIGSAWKGLCAQVAILPEINIYKYEDMQLRS